jgi:putative aminopeptidase FrvX
MPLDDTLRSLLVAQGPSGYETAPSAAWRAAAEPFAQGVEVDTMGNLTARIPARDGASNARTVAFVGHIDEIGLIVTHIDDKGRLFFIGVGGWDPQVLVSQRVDVTTRDGVVPGVVGRKAIHLLEEDERKKGVELKELYIDIGARDADEAKAMVRVGDVAVIAGEPLELPNDRVVSRALDNRLGSYIALEAARLVAEAGGAAWDVVAAAAVQEEVGLNGARALAHGLRPDVAIVIDVTHETDTLGVDPRRINAHAFGSGPVIERGTILHPQVSELMLEAAEAESIPYTLMASARGTGTDADVIHFSRNGIVTGGLGLALRYMHSSVEMVQLDDVENCAKLLAAFAQRLSADTQFTRG